MERYVQSLGSSCSKPPSLSKVPVNILGKVMIMRALLVVSALCLLPTITLAQIKSDADPPEKIMPVPNEVVKSDHEAVKGSYVRHNVQGDYRNTEVKEHAVKEHENKEHVKCKMVLIKPHRKHVRCS